MPIPIPRRLHKQVSDLLSDIRDNDQPLALEKINQFKRAVVKDYLLQLGYSSLEDQVSGAISFSFEFDARFNKHHLRLQVGTKAKKPFNLIVGDGCLWHAIEEATFDALHENNTGEQVIEKMISTFNRQQTGVRIVRMDRGPNSTAFVTAQISVPFSQNIHAMIESICEKFASLKEQN